MTGATETRKKPFRKSNQKDKTNKHELDKTYADSYIVKAFEQYAAELNAKHDKHERLVKLSRDITISSKRIIYSIHALMRSSNYNADLDKIQESFRLIRENLFKNLVKELGCDEQYEFIRAYYMGVQEYIEALTFFHFVTGGNLFNYEDILEDLKFTENSTEQESDSGANSEEISDSIPTLSADKNSNTSKILSLEVELPDYILGIQDLTGELMRFCINSFATQQHDSGFSSCEFVKKLYSAMCLLTEVPSREFSKKMNVFRQSLNKMEMACYTTRVRGTEALTFQTEHTEDDADFSTFF